MPFSVPVEDGYRPKRSPNNINKNQNLIMKKVIKTAMFAFAVVAAGFGGIKAYDAYSVKESTLMSENIEALSDDGGDAAAMTKYAWSQIHDCPGVGTGDYRACEENGPCNPCYTPCDKTCECGKNC